MFNPFKKVLEARDHTKLFLTMLIFGVFGLISALVLTVEKFRLLEEPDAVLSCSFNIVLNCSTVMQTWQASVFGFPNSLIGLMAFTIVIVIAVLGLGKVAFPRWFMIASQIGIFLGALFAYWLFFSSVYVIQVLCPWCLVVTFSMTMLLAAITYYNLRENTLQLSKTASRKVMSFLDKGYGTLVTASWLVILTALVFLKFGDSLFL